MPDFDPSHRTASHGPRVSLLGAPDIPDGQDSWTVRVPKTNVFSPDTLHLLMERSSQGAPP